MKPILEIENISKKFRIRHESHTYLSIRDSLMGIFKKNNRSTEEFYALKNINFIVKPGESIGIIGKNGAGKSTLLKILSKITPPTNGRIISRGRIASLLEVGTGFHPELSGRENIFLNGSILGMKRKEILKNFDAIIDFAGVEKFIDTPLKHYSSGMQLRLAFAVAAFLENEILIIDEVLAVGDIEFQKKCLSKMEDISNNEGKTLLFVSHQMGMINQLCKKAILLDKGKIIIEDNANKVVEHYNSISMKINTSYLINYVPLKDLYISSSGMHKLSGETAINFSYIESFYLQINCNINNNIKQCILGFQVKDRFGRIVFTSQIKLDDYNLINEKEFSAKILFPNKFLVPGQYSILSAIHIPNIRIIDQVNDLCVFNIVDLGSEFSLYEGTDYGCVYANCDWEIKKE